MGQALNLDLSDCEAQPFCTSSLQCLPLQNMYFVCVVLEQGLEEKESFLHHWPGLAHLNNTHLNVIKKEKV